MELLLFLHISNEKWFSVGERRWRRQWLGKAPCWCAIIGNNALCMTCSRWQQRYYNFSVVIFFFFLFSIYLCCRVVELFQSANSHNQHISSLFSWFRCGCYLLGCNMHDFIPVCWLYGISRLHSHFDDSSARTHMIFAVGRPIGRSADRLSKFGWINMIFLL